MYILISILLISFTEYMMHRIYLHRNSEHDHIKVHHKEYHGQNKFYHENITLFDVMSSPGYIFVSTIPNLLLALMLNNIFVYVIGLVYIIFTELIHFKFHSSKKFLNNFRKHHKIHHINYNKNYGIGSVWWDYILKTKKI